jgi:hypothetical protein
MRTFVLLFCVVMQGMCDLLAGQVSFTAFLFLHRHNIAGCQTLQGRLLSTTSINNDSLLLEEGFKMRDLSPQPEITAQLLAGVEFHPRATSGPDAAQFSDEYQVMALTNPQRLIGYLAVKPDSQGEAPGAIAINRNIPADRTVWEPNGVHLFNSQEALSASLGSNQGNLVRALYGWEANDDVLDASPYSPTSWMRDIMRRTPHFPDGTRLHAPSISTMMRYQLNKLRIPRDNKEAGEGITEQPPRISVPPRRLSVFTGRLIRMGIVREQ